MRLPAPLFVVVLLQTVLPAQSQTKVHADAIVRAKNVNVSQLDGRLPKVSLEFFLGYESAGMPVSWRVVECSKENGNRGAGSPLPTCVAAEFDRKQNGTATVVVSIADTTKPQAIPAFVRATVTDMGGAPRKVRRLGDLPMELQRPAPKGPRDLSPGAEALVFATSATSSG